MPEIKKSKKYKAICIPFLEGEDERGLNYLKKWAEKKGIEVKDFAICVYYDNPLLFPPEKCRRDICLIFDGNGSEDEKVKIKVFPEQKIASFPFNGEMRDVYTKFLKWLEKNGYERMTPLREVRGKDGKELQMGIKDTLN